jgi:hypothetical protein
MTFCTNVYFLFFLASSSQIFLTENKKCLSILSWIKSNQNWNQNANDSITAEIANIKAKQCIRAFSFTFYNRFRYKTFNFFIFRCCQGLFCKKIIIKQTKTFFFNIFQSLQMTFCWNLSLSQNANVSKS